MNFDQLKKQVLVFDIETSSNYHSGREVDIRSEFDQYVHLAQVKWFGCYSYKYKKYFNLEVSKHRSFIHKLLKEHKILVGFNSEDFDYPIICNNYLAEEDDRHVNVDLMKVLGKSNFKDKQGFAYKNRGLLMDYKFKKNSLRHMAEVMGLETQKGDIDYKLFNQDEWNEKDTEEIIKYLEGDIKSTKEMFDKVWDYWLPFTKYLDNKDINNLSWIRSSIASLTYKCACNSIGVKPEYGEKSSSKKEEMGGYVLDPQVEEKENVFCVDWSSLYPHLFSIFNLFNEVPEHTPNAWHGNDLFKVKGYYDISKKHPLCKVIDERLEERINLKKNDPTNPMIYTHKIFLNSLYGAARSEIFKNIHTPNCGWDTCLLGQQINKFAKNTFEEFGFSVIYADTDSNFLHHNDPMKNTKEYVEQCIKKIMSVISNNVPFPSETFSLDLEKELLYIMFPFSDQAYVEDDIRKELNSKVEVNGYIKALDENDTKIIIEEATGKIVKQGTKWASERTGRKKNYLYIYEKDGKKEVELVGLPIKKDNATQLGIKIYNEVLKEEIIKNNCAKFTKEYLDSIIDSYLKKPDIMEIIAVEYKVKKHDSYKNPDSQIHAQISKEYFNGQDGVIRLIKNKKFGNVGKGFSYCTIEQAKEQNLKLEDLELGKLYNELEPFLKVEENVTT